MKRACSLTALAFGASLAFLSAGCDHKRTAGEYTPAAVSAMNRGVSFMGRYDYDSAVKAFEEAVSAQPALSDAKVNLALARFNRARKEDRDIDQSLELLEAVLRSDPQNVRALYVKGIVLQHLGQAESAVTCFEQVVQQRPGDGVAWYLLGLCKQRIGKPCEEELLKAVELRPYLGSAYYRLWQVLQAAGQTEKGQPYLEKFKELRQNPLMETVELPQYNQMGELALAQPLPPQSTPPIAKSVYSLRPSRAVFEAAEPPESNAPPTSFLEGAAIFPSGTNGADFSSNIILTARRTDGSGRLLLLKIQPDGSFLDATAGSGLEEVKNPRFCSMGDVDNDGVPDLFVACAGGTRLLLGKGESGFGGPPQPGPETQAPGMRAALMLDADHDGDLDILVCNPGTPGNQLWNNNANGSYTNIAQAAGIACRDGGCILALPGDLDGDRDTDFVLLCENRPARIFLNDLLGTYHEMDTGGLDIRGDLGGVLQDLNGDGHLDLLVLGGPKARLQLFLGDGHARFRPAAGFDSIADAAGSWGTTRGVRVADMDLDGDLDAVIFSKDVHMLLNDGAGRFVLQPELLKNPGPDEILGGEVADFDGDCIPDLLCIQRDTKTHVRVLSGTLTPPSTAFSVAITGVRERDKRTRSPATPYGTWLTVRTGLGQQSRVFTGQAGGFNQSPRPLVFGIGGAKQADYVQLRWPDGVAQVEAELASGQHRAISELERKISSCPVLFAWNGDRFEFITDFAGVGGLGYFTAPGQYAQPQALEHVKLGPGQLVPRAGVFELRVTEPMEESAYVDQLELLAIDHPTDWQIYPDERLAITGTQPSRDLLVVDRPLFPKCALGPQNQDCTARLLRTDRIYAYSPELDRRFFGFCKSHTLELDFGEQVASIAPNQRLFLFLSGFLEYPYSQTAYAASQAGVGWQPIRIERLVGAEWRTIVPDAGAFGGTARTIAVDLTGLLGGPGCRLRLTSNLELYYDQVFLAQDRGRECIRTHALRLAAAELRHLGFPREFSPDGGLPLIYDYELRDETAPFDVLRGAYTRHGDVLDLLKEFDDQYALLAPGDEIALKFDAAQVSGPARGMARSFILVSRAYCKDMDLYTATSRTLEPLPFRGMSGYPYTPPEHYPDTRESRAYRQTFNTRLAE